MKKDAAKVSLALHIMAQFLHERMHETSKVSFFNAKAKDMDTH